jgi:hypothetical protein
MTPERQSRIAFAQESEQNKLAIAVGKKTKPGCAVLYRGNSWKKGMHSFAR